MSHHGSDVKFLNDLYAQLPETGATGKFPRGKLEPDDEGEIQIAIAADRERQTVLINSGKPVAWIGFTGEQARLLGESLIDKAIELRGIAKDG